MNIQQKLSRLAKYEETGKLLIPEIRAGKILDAGCGENLYKIINPSIIGVDSSCVNADVIANIDNLPFADDTFDKVLCFGVFSEEEAICTTQVSEILRVTKPFGIIYLRCLLDHPAIKLLSHLQAYKEPRIITNLYNADTRFFAAYQNA